MQTSLALEIIINSSSGTQQKEEICEKISQIFKSQGIEARIHLSKNSEEFLKFIDQALKSEEV